MREAKRDPESVTESPPPPPSEPPVSAAESPPPPPPVAADRLSPPPEQPPLPPGGGNANWGPGRAFVGLAVLVGLLLVQASVVIVIDGGDEDLSIGATLVLQAGLACSMVMVALVAANRGMGLAPASWLGLRRPRRGWVGASVLAYLVYVGFAIVIGLLLQPDQEDVTRELGVDEGAAYAILAGVLIIAAAPLSEEVFFRGFMFAGMRQSAPVWVAAVVTSAVWALFHYTGPDSWGVVLQLTVFGVVLAHLYERTGSIWPPIAIHALNNAIAFAVLTS